MIKATTTLKEYHYEALKAKAADKKLSVMQLIRGVLVKYLYREGYREAGDSEEADRLTDDGFQLAGANADGRKITDVIVIRRDPQGSKPARIYMKNYKESGYVVNEDPVGILDVALKVLLPKSIITKLQAYGRVRGYRGRSLTVALCMFFEEIKAEDILGYEVNEEFEQMMQEASQQEAFNRGTK